MTFANRRFIRLLGAATMVIIAEYILVLSDSVISGRVLGETALGAMNLLMPVFSTASFFTWILAVGTSIVYSDAMGTADRAKAAGLAGQGLIAAFCLGLLLLAATTLLETPYLAFMAPDEATMAFSGEYWRWYRLVVILESVDMLLLYLVYTDGGEVHCLVSYVGQVTVNIGMSYWLCTRIGMSGISLGTVFAYLVGIVALIPRFLSRHCQVRFRLHFDFRDLARALKAAFGDASTGLFHALLFFIITKYILCNWGSDTLPVAAVVFCIIRLTLFFNGVGIALQPLETTYHGEGNEVAISKLVRFAAAVSFAEGFLISVVIFIAPELIIDFLGIADPELTVAAKRAARITVTGLSGYALTYMFNSHLQYVGRPGRSVALTALAFLIVPTAMLAAFAPLIGTDGVWFALAAGPVFAWLTFLPFMRQMRERGPLPRLENCRLWKAGSIEATVRQVRKTLADDGFDEPFAADVANGLSRALVSLVEQNPGKKVLAELTLDRRDGVKAILRDDGRLQRINAPGAFEAIHMPTAGLNRNIFTWADIRRGNASEEAPLDYLQTYILERQQSDPRSNMFNLAKLFRLRRGVDLERLAESLVKSAQSHAALLSTIFRKADGTVVQRRTLRPEAIRCPILKMPEHDVLARKADFVRSFDIFGGLLLDACIFDCGETAYLLSNFHHLICDGYSFPLILEGARRLYEGGTVEPDAYYAVLAKRAKKASLPIADATRRLFRETVMSTDFITLPPPDFQAGTGYGSAEFPLSLPAGFDDFLARHRVTRHHVFLATTVLALARLTGADRILVDWVFHGRLSREEMQTVGALMVDVPLVVDGLSKLTAEDVVSLVKLETFRGIKRVNAFRDIRDGNPTGQDRLTFNYQDEWGELMSPGPVRLDGPYAWMIDSTIELAPPVTMTENPFNVEIMEHRDTTRLFLEYNTGRYSKATVSRYAELFAKSLQRLTSDGSASAV